MEYRAKVTREGTQWLAEFKDCPGCQTFGETRADMLEMARAALTGWLESNLASGEVPPRPKAASGTPIAVGAHLSAVLQIRWARDEQGLTQAQVAKRAGVSQQAIAKVENPDANPTLATLEKVASALGLRVDVTMRAA